MCGTEDIDWKNILINHFNYNDRVPKIGRSRHRASQPARYYVFDFDLSMPSGDRSSPKRIFWTWSSNHPRDAEPFAYDVVSMGHMLSKYNASLSLFTSSASITSPIANSTPRQPFPFSPLSLIR